MKVEEYASLDATALAELIRSGQVTAAEVEETAREAIAAMNPTVNGLVGSLFERPLAMNSSGTFAGVPFLVKDLAIHTAGVPCELGSRLARGFTLGHDTILMTRFRNAGLSILGRTNTPELGLNASTEPVANGPTRNPWDPTRTAGGSSGGSAALVAAGAVPFAHANDGGGSIRIPAANCGVVGLKPSRGRVPLGPDIDSATGGLRVEFAVTRSVRDAAALLDQVQGPAPGELFSIAPPSRPYFEELGSVPPNLRVATSCISPFGGPVDDECFFAVTRAANALGEMNHRLRIDQPPVPIEALRQLLLVYFSTSPARAINDVAARLGRTPSRDNLEATTYALWEHAERLKAMDLIQADANRNAVSRAVAAWFETVDLLVTPTCARPPWKLGELDANDPSLSAEGWLDRVFGLAPFTVLFNVTGQPAISLPLAESKDGLPIGIQLVAAHGREDLLFRVAYRLEQELPWAGRRPRIHAGR
jgi:amidase